MARHGTWTETGGGGWETLAGAAVVICAVAVVVKAAGAAAAAAAAIAAAVFWAALALTAIAAAGALGVFMYRRRHPAAVREDGRARRVGGRLGQARLPRPPSAPQVTSREEAFLDALADRIAERMDRRR